VETEAIFGGLEFGNALFGGNAAAEATGSANILLIDSKTFAAGWNDGQSFAASWNDGNSFAATWNDSRSFAL
jgi:hypothetical protein